MENNWQKTEIPKSSAVRFVEEAHPKLKSEYRASNIDGIKLFNYDCQDIARHLHGLLSEEGKHPRYLIIGGETYKDDFGATHTVGIKPIIYDRYWGKHVVCICDGIVYAPEMEKPMEKNEYLLKMFGTTDIKNEEADKF